MLSRSIGASHPPRVYPAADPSSHRSRRDRATRPAGPRYLQVLQAVFATATAGIGWDARALLVWLCAEAKRRDRRLIGGAPTIVASVSEMATELGLGWDRLERMLHDLQRAGLATWAPGTGHRPGLLTVTAYDDLVPDGRRSMGSGYTELLLGPLENELAAIGFDRWALAVLTVLAHNRAADPIEEPTGHALAARLGMTWHRLRTTVDDLDGATWAPGNVRGTTPASLTPEGPHRRLVRITADRSTARPTPTTARPTRTNCAVEPEHSCDDAHGPCSRPCDPSPPTPPADDEGPTPTTTEAKTKGGGGEEISEMTTAVADALAAKDPDAGNRLRYEMRKGTPAARRLARLVVELLAAGWPIDELAQALTARPLPAPWDTPAGLLAARAAALEMEPMGSILPTTDAWAAQANRARARQENPCPAPDCDAGQVLYDDADGYGFAKACPRCNGTGIGDGTGAPPSPLALLEAGFAACLANDHDAEEAELVGAR